MKTETVTVPEGFFGQLESYIMDLPYRYAVPIAHALAQVKEINVKEDDED